MYQCDLCKKSTKPGYKLHYKTKTRNKTYVNVLKDYNGKPKRDESGQIQEKITKGYETVKEIYTCEECSNV